jgi:triacylglycerol lipase
MAERHSAEQDTTPTLASADHAPAHVEHSDAVSRIKQVTADGWAAITEMAAIAKQHAHDMPAIMDWLQRNRGNSFATKVAAEATGGQSSDAKQSTKFPIVLIHGFNSGPATAFGDQIPASLRADGDAVFVLQLPPFASVQERAKVIAPQLEEILAKTGAAKLNLVGHSQGGLDARYLVSSMGWSDRVASVTLIATPNHGTPLADAALQAPAGIDPYMNNLEKWIGGSIHHSTMAGGSDFRGNAKSLSVAEAAEFNKQNPDAKDVYYQSWAGASSAMGGVKPGDAGAQQDPNQPAAVHGDHLNPMMYATAMGLSITAPGQLNDGAVTVDSAKWGHFNGVLPADHLDLEGVGGFAADKKRTGFDPHQFYLRMARDLAKRGY